MLAKRLFSIEYQTKSRINERSKFSENFCIEILVFQLQILSVCAGKRGPFWNKLASFLCYLIWLLLKNNLTDDKTDPTTKPLHQDELKSRFWIHFDMVLNEHFGIYKRHKFTFFHFLSHKKRFTWKSVKFPFFLTFFLNSRLKI